MSITRWLLAGATLLMGFLAGSDLDRSLVAMPAWQHVGAVEWSDFSRHADLANGLLLYPTEAIDSAVLIVATITNLHVARSGHDSAMHFLYVALALSILGLLLTMEAAPVMLGIRKVHDAAALNQALNGFRFWGDLRSICQIACFACLVGGLATLTRSTATARRDA